MNRLMVRSASRFYRRHPWQLALALVGISLGVAVYVGVGLANDSAHRAFDYSVAAAGGRITHRLLPVGGSLPESVYRDLLREHSVEHAAAVIEDEVGVATWPGRPTRLLGIDPVKLGRAGGLDWIPNRDADFARLMTEPATVMVAEELANDLGLDPGASLDLEIDGATKRVAVIGTIRSLGADPLVEAPLVADIATAQELLGRHGGIDRIDLELTEIQAASLRASLPAATVLVDAQNEDRRLKQMTQAFTTNLTALGLLALVVGMFLIYATISFAIVQRRRSIAVLRAIGVSRGQLIASLLAEALGIGIAGTAAGLLIGHVLANGLIEMVLRTMDDLYFRAALMPASRSLRAYAQGTALGIVATGLAALAPAVAAARRPPARLEQRAELEKATRRLARRAALIALPTLAVAALALLVNRQNLAIAFAALFLVLCAGAMLTPLATRGLMRALEPLGARIGRVVALMAVRGVAASLSRTGVATAALAVAVATVMSIGIMIASFRASLVDWIDTTLTADVYLSAAPGRALSPAQANALESLPEIRGLSLTRFVRLSTGLGELGARATRPGPDGWGLDIVRGDPEAALAALEAGNAVLVSEPFAFLNGLDVGGSVELTTRSGPKGFTIAGVFRDYNTVGTALLLDLDAYRAGWNDSDLTGIGVHLRPGADEAAVVGAISAALGDGFHGRLRSTAAIKGLSLAIFDRTFEITDVLRVLAGLIAFLGILSAVLAIQLERARELAILRSIGMSARQIGQQIVTQTGLLGLAAGLIAVPIGCVLAALLVYVINRRSFGWSMELIVDVKPVLEGVALAVGAALLAGLYPALVGSRTNLDRALRDE